MHSVRDFGALIIPPCDLKTIHEHIKQGERDEGELNEHHPALIFPQSFEPAVELAKFIFKQRAYPVGEAVLLAWLSPLGGIVLGSRSIRSR